MTGEEVPLEGGFLTTGTRDRRRGPGRRGTPSTATDGRIEDRAAAGSEGHRRLVELGAPATIRTVRDWVVAHLADLERGLGAGAN